MQEARLRKESHLHVSNEIVDLVTFDGVINVDNDIGDAVITAFDQITNDLLPITTNHQQVNVAKPHHRTKKPDNWEEIVQNYMYFKNVDMTMKKYNLAELNPSSDHWISTFCKWKKQHLNPSQRTIMCLMSVLGSVIEEELVAVVQRYNNHGIPMSDTILRFSLIALIGKYDRNDLLERLGDQVSIKDKLRFGRTWCHRFYKRDKFVSRIASTKMRDEIPADYEAKKERFLLHFSKAISELIVYVTKF